MNNDEIMQKLEEHTLETLCRRENFQIYRNNTAYCPIDPKIECLYRSKGKKDYYCMMLEKRIR